MCRNAPDGAEAQSEDAHHHRGAPPRAIRSLRNFVQRSARACLKFAGRLGQGLFHGDPGQVRAMLLMDGPDEVHLRTVARHELAQARGRVGQTAAYFTTPEQLLVPPRIK